MIKKQKFIKAKYVINKILFDEFQNYATKSIVPYFSKEMRERFEVYFCELNKWNKMFNLISFESESNLVYRHFCDSLYSAKIINGILINYNHSSTAQLKLCDVGTGSGMPGLPVKIVFPDVKLTLIESIAKKCKFLENMNNKLGFDVKILNRRAEDVGQMLSYRQQYDFVLSRAVSKLSSNLEISVPLLKIEGYFLVHKTKKSAENLEDGLPSVENALKHLGAKFENIIHYTLPHQDLDYCILVFKKYKNTAAQFPRKSGIPKKNPL
ncbi:MAG: 16S rRNA (guanine(527)-N(7))-methyltransferase RsmG [Endomicrobium sp.]|jgi:16S rRNA (guanine527-N7)-methyltransferase|nr:16S rRNA (guanine(527)-N(7))-methyltransferase RsmG [Endomicrobium sp.]